MADDPEDILLALEGNAYVRLPRHERKRIRALAAAELIRRHHPEYRQILHDEADRLLSQRERRLW